MAFDNPTESQPNYVIPASNGSGTIEDDIDEFLKQLEVETETTETAPATEAEATAESSAGAPAPTYGQPDSISAELLELQKGQLQVSQQIAAAMAAKQPQVETKQEKLYDFETEDLTTEEAEAFSASMPTLSKVSRNMVSQVLSDYTSKVVEPLLARNKAMEEQLQLIQQGTAATASNAAVAHLQSLVAHEIKDYNAYINSPTWQRFLNADSGSGVPNRDIVGLLAKQGNAQNIAKLMLQANKATSNAELTRQVTAGKSGTPIPVATRTGAKHPASLHRKAADSYAKGLLTKEAWDKIDSAYFNYGMQGNIDFDR